MELSEVKEGTIFLSERLGKMIINYVGDHSYWANSKPIFTAMPCVGNDKACGEVGYEEDDLPKLQVVGFEEGRSALSQVHRDLEDLIGYLRHTLESAECLETELATTKGDARELVSHVREFINNNCPLWWE